MVESKPTYSELFKRESNGVFNPDKLLKLEKAKDEDKAIRHNQGKLRYDLIEPYALEQLAKVFTFGANKYASHNWLKGMEWTKMVASLKRHLAAFEQGEDFDKETSLYHMAHVAWNAMALVSYYKYYPQGDDRLHWRIPKKRIGLDVDEVVCNWVEEWCKLHNIDIPSSWYFQWDITGLFEKMRAEGSLDDFYSGLSPRIQADSFEFEPVAYISHRPVAEEITKRWLEKHNFPLKPVYHVKDRSEKVKIAQELKLDIFVDDSYETFQAMNQAGVCCYLMDAKHNQRYNVGYRRLKSLSELHV